MTTELLEWIERFEQARDELAAVIVEAHAATKAANQARSELEARRAEILTELNGQMNEALNQRIDEFLQEAIPQLKNYMDRIHNRIVSQFAQLEQAMFYGTTGEDLRKKARAAADAGMGADPNLPNLNRRFGKERSKGKPPKNRP